MNNKRTNYLIAILNIIVVITMILITVFASDIGKAVMVNYDDYGIVTVESLYGCRALEIFAYNIKLIFMMACGSLTITNIVSAIQNRKNKKIFFWQLAFGFLILFIGINAADLVDSDIMEWSDRILIGALPIMFAIINIIKIRRNKPTRLKFISYIIAIVLAIVSFIFIGIMLYIWSLIIIIMQFIYIHKQEKNIDESNAKKIINIILYYVIETLIVILFFSISAISIVNTKVNEARYEKEFLNICKKIYNMQGVENDETYIPVEKDSKYGYIDENNKEKIACEYDRVTFFQKGEINGKECHFALAEKDKCDYIISKSNDKIEISNNKYFKIFKKFMRYKS